MHQRAWRTEGRKDERPRINMPLQLLRSWGSRTPISWGEVMSSFFCFFLSKTIYLQNKTGTSDSIFLYILLYALADIPGSSGFQGEGLQVKWITVITSITCTEGWLSMHRAPPANVRIWRMANCFYETLSLKIPQKSLFRHQIQLPTHGVNPGTFRSRGSYTIHHWATRLSTPVSLLRFIFYRWSKLKRKKCARCRTWTCDLL